MQWRGGMVVAFTLALLAAAADSHGQPALRAKLVGKEIVNPTSLVSQDDGTSGASVSSTRSQSADPMRPMIWFRSPYAGTLTLSVLAADGRYRSRYEISAQVPGPGWIPVDLPTEHSARIRAYATHQLAFEVRRSDTMTLMLVAWREPADEETVTLYLTAPYGAYLLEPLSKREIDCEKVTGVVTFHYDHRCSLSLKAFQAAIAGGQPIKVFRAGLGPSVYESAVFKF